MEGTVLNYFPPYFNNNKLKLKKMKINLKEDKVQVTLIKDIAGKRAGQKIYTHPLNVKALVKNGVIEGAKKNKD